MPDRTGPLLDIVQLTREAIERVWWSGFWTGGTAGAAVGFLVGGIFVAVIVSARK